MAKLIIDQNKCIICGTCAVVYPKHFKIVNNGKVEVIGTEIDDQKAQDMASVCPVEAIAIKKD